MNAEVRPEVVDLVFDYIRGAPEQQLHDSDAIDAKTVQVFSAASVIIGLAGISAVKGLGLPGYLLIPAIAAYVLAGLAAFVQLRPREFLRSLHGKNLWESGWSHTPTEIKHALIENVQEAYEHNETLLKEKAKCLRIVVIAVAVEVLFVGCSLIASRV